MSVAHALSVSAHPGRLSGRRFGNLLRRLLEVPLVMKLLGANLVILAVAIPALLAILPVNPGRATDVYVLIGAMAVAAAVNFYLVRLALSPIAELERVAKRVSEGRFGERVAPSIVADPELAQLAVTINEMLDKLAAGRERMRRLGAEVVYAEERERARVARDLHDTVGQTLAAATFQIAAAANDIEIGPATARLNEVRELLRTSLEDIRNLSRSLHPRVASDLGLPAALEALADATQHRSLIDVKVEVDVDGIVIPSPLAATLYRVAQEALRNVERHADAGQVIVSLRARPGLVELVVADDGCGIDGPLEARSRDAGLASMRERLSLAGGELSIDSNAQTGTRVVAWIGLDTEAA